MDAVSGIENFLQYVLHGMTERPERTQVIRRDAEGGHVFDLHMDERDVPRLIGRAGDTVNALRRLVQAAAAQQGVRIGVEIAEG